MMRTTCVILLSLASAVAWAFPEVPKESKVLGVTKGSEFSSGLVFVNGKFIKPPYVVDRWGTGIRINKIFVTGPVIEWSEFLKTQSGVKVETPAAPAATPQTSVASAPATTTTTSDDDDLSLDDLFDDDPKPKKKGDKKSAKKFGARKPAAPKAPQPVYTLEGDFVKNEASEALKRRINAARTEIDGILRKGGLICFGDRYSRIVGGESTARKLLQTLPELQMRNEDLPAFLAAVRAAGLYFLSDPVSRDLFRNRIDYRALQEHRQRQRKDDEWKKLMETKPLF